MYPLRSLLIAATLVFSASCLATGTGPTNPNEGPQHPLDSEPQPEAIEQQRDGKKQPSPRSQPPQEQPAEPVDKPVLPLPEQHSAEPAELIGISGRSCQEPVA